MSEPAPDAVGERIDALLGELVERAGPEVAGRAEEMVRLLVGLYGRALDRVLSAAGPDLAERLAADDLVGGLLIVHGLHPHSPEERAERALADLRRSLGARGAGVALVGIDDDGVAHVRVGGPGDGCDATAVHRLIEEAVTAAAPDLAGVEVEAPAPAPAFIPLGAVRRRGPPAAEPATGRSA